MMKQLVRRSALLVGLLTSCLMVSHASAEMALVRFGEDADWRYQDDGAAPSVEWRKADFDDSTWKLGPAPLGYGDPGLNTTVSFGDDPRKKHITAYFRHTFDVANVDGLGRLLLLIRSDDGIVVYLNGDEIIRNNLPEGHVESTSTATRALGGLDERLYRRFVVPATHLVSGSNVIAVEVHQANPQSSDLFLDLVLRSYGVDEKLRPTVVQAARKATVEYHSKHYVGPEMAIPDGYVDGGRRMKISNDDNVRSGRELIVVDRSRDAFLREHLEFARSEEVKALEPLKRARHLAAYVYQTMTLRGYDGSPVAAVDLMVKEYQNEGVLLGEVPRICGAGVCRHRTLLFKLLADEAGLDLALVRGNYNDGRVSSGHAWNELRLEDGRRVLFDVMNNRMAPIGSKGSTLSRRYLTVEDEPLYANPGSDAP